MSNPAKAQISKSDHTRGVVLVVLSAITFSTVGIFTKGVEASAWDVIFWRGLSGAILTFLFLCLRSGVMDEVRRFGMPAILAAVLMASGTAAFIPAFKLTSVANVSIIWATAPFVTALLAMIFIKERPTAWILICSGMALTGVIITVMGSTDKGHIYGDLLALWMTFMMAATFVVYRAWPDTPTKLPAILASVILLPIAMTVSNPSKVSGVEIGILCVFGLVFAVASVLMVEGARLVPAAQTALLSALETPLAPIWAIIILLEWPSLPALIGGTIIMIAVVMSQMRKRKPQV